jgi:dUTP pyrophosphatase
MIHWLVELYANPIAQETLTFSCIAEDEDHAKEQALDAYPNGEVWDILQSDPPDTRDYEMVFIEEAAIMIPVVGDVPKKSYRTDAAFDLTAAVSITLYPDGWCTVPTNTSMAIPEGMVGLICPRSGLASLHGITILNAPGIVDPGYTGKIGVVLHNTGSAPRWIEEGDRIAQLLIMSMPLAQFQPTNMLPLTERLKGGFGSTGS